MAVKENLMVTIDFYYKNNVFPDITWNKKTFIEASCNNNILWKKFFAVAILKVYESFLFRKS